MHLTIGFLLEIVWCILMGNLCFTSNFQVLYAHTFGCWCKFKWGLRTIEKTCTPCLKVVLTKTHYICLVYFSFSNFCKVHMYILRRPQNFAKSPPIIWLAVHRTNNLWRFCKILLPSQNIWTLTTKNLWFCGISILFG